MKKYFLVSILFLATFKIWSQNEKIPKLKLNSLAVDYFLYNNVSYLTSDDIQSYYKNTNDYVSLLSKDSTIDSGKGVLSTIGDVTISVSAGFTPFSKKKGQYLNRQEIVFGVYNSNFWKRNEQNIYSKISVLDVLNTYTTSTTTGDTLSTDSSYLIKTNSTFEDYTFYGKKLTFFSEWFFKTNTDKRLIYSLAPGIRLSYIYNTNIDYRYKEINTYSTTIDTLYPTINSDYRYEDVLNDVSSLKKGKNGLAFEPYLKANVELKLSMKDKFYNHFTLNIYGYSGLTFNKIFGTKTDFSFLYGLGIGLKYKPIAS